MHKTKLNKRMRKNYLLTLLAIVAGFVLSNAQIKLNVVNHLAPSNENDTLLFTSNIGLKAPSTGANQKWNYGHLKDSMESGLYFFTYTNWHAGTNSNFPGATRYFVQGNLIAGQITLYTDIYENDNSKADAYVGGGVGYRQSFPIGSVTMGPNDSLVFPVQSDVYPQPDVILNYPATYNSNWSSKSRSITNFNLTVAAYSLNKTPGAKVTNRIRTDSVVGWGMLNVPYPTGGQSQYDSVLEVKESIMDLDSYYLGGSAAPAPLLSAFGLSNGARSGANRYIFYRTGHNEPLFEIFMDSAWKKPQLAAYDAQYTVFMGIDLRGPESFASSAYPNPVSNRSLNLQFNKTSPGVWTITISNIMGQTVNSVELSQGIGNISTQVAMPPSAANGVYIYSIRAEDGSVSQGKFLLNR